MFRPKLLSLPGLKVLFASPCNSFIFPGESLLGRVDSNSRSTCLKELCNVEFVSVLFLSRWKSCSYLINTLEFSTNDFEFSHLNSIKSFKLEGVLLSFPDQIKINLIPENY